MMRVDYQHRSKRYWQTNNLDVQEAVDLVNARAEFQADRWSILAYVRPDDPQQSAADRAFK